MTEAWLAVTFPTASPGASRIRSPGRFVRGSAVRKSGFRAFGYGKMGNLDKLCAIMSPGKTVSKLRSAPAPYLVPAPAPKLGVGVDLNRCRDRVGCLLGPDTVLTRSRSHRGRIPISLRGGPYLDETLARRRTTCSAGSPQPPRRDRGAKRPARRLEPRRAWAGTDYVDRAERPLGGGGCPRGAGCPACTFN